jgi:hypothetical protein
MAHLINNINNKFHRRSYETVSFFFVLVLFSSVLFAQGEEIPNKQFMLGCTNVGSTEQVTHYIEAISAVWEKSSDNFIISSNQSVYNNSLVTTGNANFNEPDWPGFNFIWLNTGITMPRWGLGLYKVTNSKQTDKYFYIDARDKSYGTITGGYTTPDFYVYFNNENSVYQYNRFFPQPTIPNGGLISVWEIFGKTPNTSGLQNYWSNVLVIVKSLNNHPHLIWGQYPDNNFSVQYYKVYRSNNCTHGWEYIGQTSAFDYEDQTQEYCTAIPPAQCTETCVFYYRVTAVNNSSVESDPTNEASVVLVGGPPEKAVMNETFSNEPISYSLSQNYPNPFNPATVITYSIPENSFISLKVYDVLGNEISELANEVKEPGIYSVSFDASKLSSGIYFYTIKANGHSFTKKMLLAK